MYTLPPLFKQLAVGLLAISLSAITGISEAALLYEQAPLVPVDGPQADINAGTGLFADNFAIAHSKLESISWWGAYLSEDSDDFAVKLYSDLAGTGTLLHDFGSAPVSRTSLTDSSGNPYYQYQYALSTPLELLAGNYYLSVQNQGDSSWAWLYGNPGNSSFSNLPDSAAPAWSVAKDENDQVIPHDLAFRLEGSQIQNVPEPEIMILLLLGGGMLALSFKPGHRPRVA